MGNFNKGGGDRKFGGGGGFKKYGNDRGDRGDRGGDRLEVTMHRAVCSECGNNCEVPFKPSNDKPVFCNDCFGSKRDARDTRERGTKENYVSNPRREHGESRPEYSKPAPTVTINNQATEKQFSEIITRLDKLTQILELSLVKKVESKSEVKKVVEVKKVPEKKVEVKVKKVVAKKKK